ncbi:MAG: hypothetical protein RR957_04775 [Oscillospiraceae bacterium]
MRGVEFLEPIAKKINAKMLEHRYLVGTIGDSTLRIVPPLIVTKPQIDEFLKTLEICLNEV